MRILYPMFVHCHLSLVKLDAGATARDFHRRFAPDHELLHGEDVAKLRGLASPEHVASDATARAFLENKLPVRCCEYTFDLLIKYLHLANQMALLAILNARVAVTVVPGDPSPREDEVDVSARSAITGAGPPSEIDAFNQKHAGRWGILEESMEIRAMDEFEEERREAEKAAEKAAEDAGGDGDKAGAKAAPLSKKKQAQERAKEREEEAKREAEAKAKRQSGPTIVRSEIPVPELSYGARLAAVEDIRYRCAVSADAPPSVACYTFTHAHKLLNCAAVTSDAALVAGGFADSVVRVWDMNAAAGSGPEGTNRDVYETDPESRARRAARDAALDGVATPSSAPGGDAEMTDAAPIDPEGSRGGSGSRSRGGSGAGSAPSRGAKVAAETPCDEYFGHSSAVHGVDFSPDGDFLLSCSRDRTARVWSLRLKTCLAVYRAHTAPVWCAKWAPTGHYFATGSLDGTARVWATDASAPRRVLVGHLGDVDCVAWHPNCNYVATGSSDRTVRVFDVATGACVRILVGHHAGVRALAMRPDGRCVASGGDDGGVLEWDLGTGKPIRAFEGHRGAVYSLDYSGGVKRDQRVLASGGADETVRLWDASERGGGATERAGGAVAGREIGETLRTKSTPVVNVQFTARNLLMAMGARASSKR
jgi:transcription initiation factor TFIID subunit 5